MKIEQDYTLYMSDILKDMNMGNIKKITIYKTSACGKTTTIDNRVLLQKSIQCGNTLRLASIFTKTWEEEPC